jgi:hypothetical protein
MKRALRIVIVHALTVIGVLCLQISADPILEGQSLAAGLRKLRIGIPGNLTATLKVRKRDGSRYERSVRKETHLLRDGWRDIFCLESPKHPEKEWLSIEHPENQPPRYQVAFSDTFPTDPKAFMSLDADQAMRPVGESDFWMVDLGLDFLHWPDQRLVPSKVTMRKGMSCKVLESSRPSSSTTSYNKVRSWISSEYGGVVYAEAFDIKNRKIKIFEVNDVERIGKQWYLKALKIRNLRDRSASVLEFNNTAQIAEPFPEGAQVP